MDKAKALESLFEKWMQEPNHIGVKPFNIDGIVNYDAWDNAEKKILFIFKEAWHKSNIKDSKYDLCEDLNENGPWKMWNRVAEWIYAIQSTDENCVPAFRHLTSKNKNQLLKQIAVINIKKSGGTSSSNALDLQQYAKSDERYLKEQIEIINPSIIVCGNTLQYLRNILVKSDVQNPNWYYWDSGRLIIDYYHPANKFPSQLNFYGLAAVYHQALRNSKVERR